MVLRSISSTSVRRFTLSSNLTCDQKRLLQTRNSTGFRSRQAGAAPSHRIQQRAAPNLTARLPGRQHRRSVTEISLQNIRLSSPSSSSSSPSLPPASIHCKPFSTSQQLYRSKQIHKYLNLSHEDSGLTETNKKPSIMPSGTHLPLQLINILPFQALALHIQVMSEHLWSSGKEILHCMRRPGTCFTASRPTLSTLQRR